jgi:hypothetical protein
MAYNRLSMYKTRIENTDNVMQVIYHNTAIVSVDNSSGNITLNSGGYESVTTKRKMNQASRQFNLGYSVFQKNFIWYVTYKDETMEFYDGMILGG